METIKVPEDKSQHQVLVELQVAEKIWVWTQHDGTTRAKKEEDEEWVEEVKVEEQEEETFIYPTVGTFA